MKAKLKGLVEHWTRLAAIAEGLAANPPPNAPFSYASACRGQKQAYEDCARDLRAAMQPRSEPGATGERS